MTKRANAWSRKATPIAVRRTPRIRSAAGTEFVSHPVSSQGIRPAATPGAITRKSALPSAAQALRPGRRLLAGELRDQRGQALGLILGDEGVGVLDPLQGGALDLLGEPLGEGDLEEAILHRPGEQRRPIEFRQPL